ncbi:MAG: hypothetical protein IPM92_10580 [Saprospiraceae bacterium]|nr:hypothetical protein [Saprospiraceae bacterium]
MVSQTLLKILTGKFAAGITLWPFVILRNHALKENAVFLNHEKIHLKQQAELLIVFFYLWYGIEYVAHWCRLKNKKQAYYRISFEREAYANETNLRYLEKRKMFAFWRYV